MTPSGLIYEVDKWYVTSGVVVEREKGYHFLKFYQTQRHDKLRATEKGTKNK